MRIQDDPERLSKHAANLLNKLQAGAILCTTPGEPEGDGVARSARFWIEPRGKSVGPSAVRELLKKQRIAPQPDGLLDDCPQTFRVQA